MVPNQTVVDKLVEVNALLQQLDRKSEALRDLPFDEDVRSEMQKLQRCLAEARRAVHTIRSRCTKM